MHTTSLEGLCINGRHFLSKTRVDVPVRGGSRTWSLSLSNGAPTRFGSHVPSQTHDLFLLMLTLCSHLSLLPPYFAVTFLFSRVVSTCCPLWIICPFMGIFLLMLTLHSDLPLLPPSSAITFLFSLVVSTCYPLWIICPFMSICMTFWSQLVNLSPFD